MPRPLFQPTAEQREVVARAAAFGLTEDQIAKLIINPRTGKVMAAKHLRRCFREELDEGHAKALYEVANRLFHECVHGTGKEAAAQRIFYLKTRGQWSERQIIEIEDRKEISETPLTDAEWEAQFAEGAGVGTAAGTATRAH